MVLYNGGIVHFNSIRKISIECIAFVAFFLLFEDRNMPLTYCKYICTRKYSIKNMLFFVFFLQFYSTILLYTFINIFFLDFVVSCSVKRCLHYDWAFALIRMYFVVTDYYKYFAHSNAKIINGATIWWSSMHTWLFNVFPSNK